MKRRKRHLSAEFKASVASEALKGVRSVNDIAQQYEVAPSRHTKIKTK